MAWQLWIVAALFTLSALATVGSVGRPRPPITAGAAVFSVVLAAVVVALLVTA